MDVDQAGVRAVLVAPHRVQELLAGEGLPGRAGQGGQQVELQRGHRNGLGPAQDAVGGDVNVQVPGAQHLRGDGGGQVAQARPHPGQELGGLEGLGDVVVGPGLQPRHDVLGVGTGREHNDRDGGQAADLAADLHPVDPREHEVKQDQGGVVGAEEGQSTVTGVTGDWRVPLALQQDAQHLGDRGVVVNNEDTHGHVSYLGTPGTLRQSQRVPGPSPGWLSPDRPLPDP